VCLTRNFAPSCSMTGSALEVLALADLIDEDGSPYRVINARRDSDFYLGSLEGCEKGVPIADLPHSATEELKHMRDAHRESAQVRRPQQNLCVCVCVCERERERERDRQTLCVVFSY
jgi:hypothetical protein